MADEKYTNPERHRRRSHSPRLAFRELRRRCRRARPDGHGRLEGGCQGLKVRRWDLRVLRHGARMETEELCDLLCLRRITLLSWPGTDVDNNRGPSAVFPAVQWRSPNLSRDLGKQPTPLELGKPKVCSLSYVSCSQ